MSNHKTYIQAYLVISVCVTFGKVVNHTVNYQVARSNFNPAYWWEWDEIIKSLYFTHMLFGTLGLRRRDMSKCRTRWKSTVSWSCESLAVQPGLSLLQFAPKASHQLFRSSSLPGSLSPPIPITPLPLNELLIMGIACGAQQQALYFIFLLCFLFSFFKYGPTLSVYWVWVFYFIYPSLTNNWGNGTLKLVTLWVVF